MPTLSCLLSLELRPEGQTLLRIEVGLTPAKAQAGTSVPHRCMLLCYPASQALKQAALLPCGPQGIPQPRPGSVLSQGNPFTDKAADQVGGRRILASPLS